MRHYSAFLVAVVAGSLLSMNAVPIIASSTMRELTHSASGTTTGAPQLAPRVVRPQDRGFFFRLFRRLEEPEAACALAVRSRNRDATKKRCGGGGDGGGASGAGGDFGGGEGSVGGGGGDFGGGEPSAGESSSGASGTSSGLGESIAKSSPEILEPQTVTVTGSRPIAQPVQVAGWSFDVHGHASSSGPTEIGVSASWKSDEGAASASNPSPATPKPVTPHKPVTPTPKKPTLSVPKMGGGKGRMPPRKRKLENRTLA